MLFATNVFCQLVKSEKLQSLHSFIVMRCGEYWCSLWRNRKEGNESSLFLQYEDVVFLSKEKIWKNLSAA